MILDIKNTTVYLVSPGTDKYKDRVLTVFRRLIDEGFSKIEFVKSLPGLNGAASLTHTVLHIFKRELNNDKPFIILEDDCAFFNKYEQIVWFAVSKMSLIENVLIFDSFEREELTPCQFSVKDIPLDELIDIYNYIQYELQNA
jgi:hypothetical protein